MYPTAFDSDDAFILHSFCHTLRNLKRRLDELYNASILEALIDGCFYVIK